jgi:RNA polymerase sigma-70 factor (ECF subfamily)
VGRERQGEGQGKGQDRGRGGLVYVRLAVANGPGAEYYDSRARANYLYEYREREHHLNNYGVDDHKYDRIVTAIAIPVRVTPSADNETTATARMVDDVFTALGPAVHGYLRAAGAHDSEDVLSEVFVGVARGLGRFRGDDGDLRRWVFTIARNCLMDEHRRRGRQRLFVRSLASAEPAVSAANDPLDPALQDALLKLTPDQREVVTLRFVADLSLDEVARITGRPAGAVKSLQHRALRSLASALTTEPLAGALVDRPDRAH